MAMGIHKLPGSSNRFPGNSRNPGHGGRVAAGALAREINRTATPAAHLNGHSNGLFASPLHPMQAYCWPTACPHRELGVLVCRCYKLRCTTHINTNDFQCDVTQRIPTVIAMTFPGFPRNGHFRAGNSNWNSTYFNAGIGNSRALFDTIFPIPIFLSNADDIVMFYVGGVHYETLLHFDEDFVEVEDLHSG